LDFLISHKRPNSNGIRVYRQETDPCSSSRSASGSFATLGVVADAELCGGRAVSLKTAKGKGEEIREKE
jgi:hypothetical protein